jgi:hypothetical protein
MRHLSYSEEFVRNSHQAFFRTKIENFGKRPDWNSGQILQNKDEALDKFVGFDGEAVFA